MQRGRSWLGGVVGWAVRWSLALVSTALCALGPNPSHDWRSADSEHFVVHYAAARRLQAEQAVAIAERVLPRIATALRWQPEAKIQIVLIDDYDYANGFATPLPFNHTGIFLTPPDDGELLDNSDWLELVLTHELVHIVHLDKVRGAPRVLQQIFGRHPLWFPALWQPSWLIEGLATYFESDPSRGRGRLDSPLFDAYMRLELQQGVKSLRELNADGRAFPINKAYLYGAYFYRFLAERYGEAAVFRVVDGYSDNVIPFRIHSNPVSVTGKPLDALWQEYQDWLQARFASAANPTRSAAATAASTALLATPAWQLDSPVLTPDGSVYVVHDDGVDRPQLLRLRDGVATPLQALEPGARIDVNARADVLITQPEICDNYQVFFDLYRWDENTGLQRLSQCGRYRMAVWHGEQEIIALHNGSGRAELHALDRDGRLLQRVYVAAVDETVTAVAVSADGRRIAWLGKRAGQWQLHEMQRADGSIQRLYESATPLLSLRYLPNDDLLWVQAEQGVFNARHWQRASDLATTVTAANAAVLATSSVQAGEWVSVQLVAGGYQLYRHTLAPLPADDSRHEIEVASTYAAALPALSDNAAVVSANLTQERPYSALETLAPQAWFPTLQIADGAQAFGVELFGQDAVGWHQYTLSPQFEFSQQEWLGSFVYGYDQRHFLAVFRTLDVTGTEEDDDGDDVIRRYELQTTGQWLSLLPWWQFDQRLQFGVGAARSREIYQVVDGPRIELQDEQVAAAFFSYDSRRSNWWSEGVNHGQLFSLQAESYDPFDGQYEGKVYRADWRGYVGWGRSTLALRWTEARGEAGTEPFELGGSNTSEHSGLPRLNERDLALRGYDNGKPALTGKRARIVGAEWRLPLADIDRHLMTPPLGLNRLSGALFYEAGAAWSETARPDQYYRAAGVELLAELKLGYRLGLLLRAGYARGLDAPGGDELYLQLGRSF